MKRKGLTARSVPGARKKRQRLPEPVMPSCPPRRLLEGQKALVTGASTGIGRAIAAALGAAGAEVAVNYRDQRERAEVVVREIERAGSRAFAVRADVSRQVQVRRMFRAVRERFGTLDILVNNAGVQKDAPFDRMRLSDWRKVIDVNLTGAFLCSREAVRAFKRQGVRPEVSCAAGKILAVSSVHEVIPWAGHVNYAASKAGLSMLVKSLAQEAAARRIRVNAVAPGAVRTAINEAAWKTPAAYRELMKLIPYNRIGEADEIGRAAVWLVSDEADYVNGATLFVDGGMTLYPGFETGG